jgi:hypothetical protein
VKVCGPEHPENRRLMALKYHEFQRFNTILRGNLADFIYLQQYPGTPIERLPAKINWNGVRSGAYDSAWNAAKRENLTALMRPGELYNYESLYRWFDRVAIAFDRFRTTFNEARYHTIRDIDPSHLTPQQIEKEIELTEASIYEHYYYGLGLYGLSANFPDMPAPSLRELQAIVHESDEAGTGFSPEAMRDLRSGLRNPADTPGNDTSTKDASAH